MDDAELKEELKKEDDKYFWILLISGILATILLGLLYLRNLGGY